MIKMFILQRFKRTLILRHMNNKVENTMRIIVETFKGNESAEDKEAQGQIWCTLPFPVRSRENARNTRIEEYYTLVYANSLAHFRGRSRRLMNCLN